MYLLSNMAMFGIYVKFLGGKSYQTGSLLMQKLGFLFFKNQSRKKGWDSYFSCFHPKIAVWMHEEVKYQTHIKHQLRYTFDFGSSFFGGKTIKVIAHLPSILSAKMIHEFGFFLSNIAGWDFQFKSAEKSKRICFSYERKGSSCEKTTWD